MMRGGPSHTKEIVRALGQREVTLLLVTSLRGTKISGSASIMRQLSPERQRGRAMHFVTPFCLGLIAAVLAGLAYSQDGDDALRPYAIHIDRTHGPPLNGYGVYLGNGFVITAAHV